MSGLDHIILYVTFFFILFVFCKQSVKIATFGQFVKTALPFILIFLLTEGCRYGRGADYLSYKYRFEHIIPMEEPQKLFLWLMQLLNELGMNYVGAFVTYALIFILGIWFFVWRTFNNREAKWMYFFSNLALFNMFETFIREFIAFPVFACGLALILKPKISLGKQITIGLITIFVVTNIHSGVLFCIPFLLAGYIWQKKIIDWKYSVVILFMVYYVIPAGALSNIFINILGGINLDSIRAMDHMSHYIDNSDRWLGEDSVLSASKQSVITMTLQFLFECGVIILGYYALKFRSKQVVLMFYHTMIVGFIFCRMFHGYEIFARMFGQLYLWWFVPLGYSLYVLSLKKNQINVLLKGSLCAVVSYLFMFWARFIFLYPEATFVWNL